MDDEEREREKERENMERGQSGPVTLGVTSWVRLPIMGPRGMTKVPDRYRIYSVYFLSYSVGVMHNS